MTREIQQVRQGFPLNFKSAKGQGLVDEGPQGITFNYHPKPTMFERVQAFHAKFGVETIGSDIPKDVQEFRVKFLQEELDELKKAYAERDHENIFDALIDLVYVALGTADLHGFNFDEGFNRVHVANMAKVRCQSAEESKRGHSLDIRKPEGWKAPDLSDLVI